MISIDKAHEMLEQIAAEFPAEFYEKLNGGICLLPEVKYSPHARANDLYILGEYHRNVMGRYIYIYYGSFCRVYGHLDEEQFYAKLRKTVAHEFTHHLENLAGERGLEHKDEDDLEDYLHRKGPQ
ncbi:MAG: metallopeptidase family protein [Oscillospiraceae bacterium]|nr:metallopeptidase family protein [Oscillospiraceae bacterium]